jgi:RimJ/RimL family protein N-acetyltransferase
VDGDTRFLGYVGIMKRSDGDHPLGPHYEVGWRLHKSAWGYGYASEGARRALEHAWSVLDVSEILSYTSAENQPSRRVMERLGLRRDLTRDFTARYPRGDWNGLVWVATRPVGPSDR